MNSLNSQLLADIPKEAVWPVTVRFSGTTLVASREELASLRFEFGDAEEARVEVEYCVNSHYPVSLVKHERVVPIPESPDDLLETLNTYEIRDPKGKLLTTVQGNDPRSVLGIMMLVWGEGISVRQVDADCAKWGAE